MKPFYQRENVTIWCGEAGKIMGRYIETGSIDLTVTSPPYGEMRKYNGYTFDFERIAGELWRVTTKGGVLVWVVGDETEDFCESLTEARQKVYFVETCGFNLLDTMIYHKNGYPAQYPGMMRYMGAFEYMIVLSNGKPKTFNPIMDRQTKTAGESRDSFTQRQQDGSTKHTKTGFEIGTHSSRNNVWQYNTGYLRVTLDRIAYKHPAIFPEALARDHILSWSNPGDLVFDPMLGSGTTAKMAQQLGRRFVGCEISEEYCRIAVDRLRQPILFSLPNVEKIETRAEQGTLF